MMRSHNFTPHAIMRMAQRAFSEQEVEMAIAIGTMVEGGYLVRRKDAQELLSWLKHVQAQVEKLAGMRVVIYGGTVVTTYRTQGKDRDRLLMEKRKCRRRS